MNELNIIDEKGRFAMTLTWFLGVAALLWVGHALPLVLATVSANCAYMSDLGTFRKQSSVILKYAFHAAYVTGAASIAASAFYLLK